MVPFSVLLLLLGVSLLTAQDSELRGVHNCGGPGGETTWTDEEYFLTHGPITSIEVWHGLVIDGIRFTYGQQQAPRRGGDGGDLFTYSLGIGEEIIGVRMSKGRESIQHNEVVCKIKFYIKRLDGFIFSLPELGVCDKGDEEDCGEYIPNRPLQYTRGRYDDYIDFLEFQFEEQSVPEAD